MFYGTYFNHCYLKSSSVVTVHCKCHFTFEFRVIFLHYLTVVLRHGSSVHSVVADTAVVPSSCCLGLTNFLVY